jgi:ribosomal protein S18 acetylase RimI-like enzyme
MADPKSLTVQFRKATRRDVPRVTELYLDCFGKWSKAEQIPDYIDEMATNKDWQMIVAEDKPGHIAGFVLINCNYAEPHPGGFVNVDVLAVDEKCRGLGLGKSLMGMADMVARNESVGVVSLQVHEDNAGGIKLYHTLKFNEVGRREAYYSDGRAAIDMIKVLGPAAANDVEPHPATLRPKRSALQKFFGL